MTNVKHFRWSLLLILVMLTPMLPAQNSKKYKKAMELYETARAYFVKGENQNLPLALSYYRQAADLEPSFSAGAGECFEFGVACELDPTIALDYYQRGNEGGDDNYAKYFGVDYFVNQIRDGSLDSISFDLFKRAILYRSMKASPDGREDLAWLTQAADRGYVPAMFELGANYMTGYYDTGSLSDNLDVAERWLRRAAESQYIPALHQLGVLYEQSYKDELGHVLPEGFEKALPYYQAAAKAGFPPSQCAMAFYDYNGLAGMEVNQEAGEVWLQKSANQGYHRAKVLLEQLQRYNKEQRWIQREEFNYRLEATLDKVKASLTPFIEGISNKQASMTDSQQKMMQQCGYSHNSNSFSSAASSASDKKQYPSSADLNRRNTEKRIYDDYEDMLMNMYYGHAIYSDRNRLDYQAKMRSIRQNWEGQDMWIGSPSKWETWDGVCKYYKK